MPSAEVNWKKWLGMKILSSGEYILNYRRHLFHVGEAVASIDYMLHSTKIKNRANIGSVTIKSEVFKTLQDWKNMTQIIPLRKIIIKRKYFWP